MSRIETINALEELKASADTLGLLPSPDDYARIGTAQQHVEEKADLPDNLYTTVGQALNEIPEDEVPQSFIHRIGDPEIVVITEVGVGELCDGTTECKWDVCSSAAKIAVKSCDE